jgi:hypothetical protein
MIQSYHNFQQGDAAMFIIVAISKTLPFGVERAYLYIECADKQTAEVESSKLTEDYSITIVKG